MHKHLSLLIFLLFTFIDLSHFVFGSELSTFFGASLLIMNCILRNWRGGGLISNGTACLKVSDI